MNEVLILTPSSFLQVLTITIRDGYDETMIVDPDNLQFIFQGMLEKDKSGRGYGQFQWRICMLTPIQ